VIRRIAVILRGRIGDLCCTWPLLSWLKEQHPGCSIDLFGEPIHRELAPLIPAIDRFWLLPMQPNRYLSGWCYGRLWRGQYDMAIAAHTRPRSWVAWFLRAMGAPQQVAFVDGRRRFRHIQNARHWNAPYEEAHHETFKLFQLLDPMCEQVPKRLWPRLKIPESWRPEPLTQPLVTASISSNRPSCRLDLKRWAEALNQLQGVSIAISHLPQDRPQAERLATLVARARPVATPSLKQLLLLLEASRCVVTSEGGVSHLAAALDKPQLVLFGGTSPTQWAPLTDKALILSHPVHVDQIDPQTIHNALLQVSK
jgi:heptosyltransferase III